VTNLATGVGVTVGQLVERIVDLVGRPLPVVESAQRKRPDTSEVFRLLGSAARAAERAGWTPQVSLGEGLARTVAWFRRRGRPADVAQYRV
jgi:nucleoside-diphosphate-sugar epimerase